MKKFFLASCFLISLSPAFSQIDSSVLNTPRTPKVKKTFNDMDLGNRSNDHLVIQFGMDGWSAAPDSVQPSGFSRHFNAYFMLDKPFKTNPHLSVAIGAGISSSNMFFTNTRIDLKSSAAKLPFTNLDSTDRFKKYKLTTVYAEAPVELRYSANPATGKGFKFAVGGKIGTMINAHTKGKTLQSKTNQTIGDYTEKIASKKFFNTTRLSATARVGYGLVSLHGAYQVSALLKDGTGPVIHPYSIGLTISGL